MKNTVAALMLSAGLLTGNLFGAAIVKVNLDSGDVGVLKNSDGTTNLTAGNVNVAGDGAVVQLGYFSGATSDNNNFVGNFVPITGQGSANFGKAPDFNTTIGDFGLGADSPGSINLSVIFDSAASLLNLPQVGTVLSLRIYNGTTLANSSHFMLLSNNAWKWKDFRDSTDPGSNLNMSLADTGTRYQTASFTATGVSSPATPSANLPVPEPSTAALALFGAIPVFMRRRKV
jgi:hypothetical protein